MRKMIITGGPCSGKTTVINMLSQKGYTIVSETAREIIKEEENRVNPILPWTDIKTFQEKVIDRQSLKEKLIENKNVDSYTFLDRALPDGIAYAELAGIKLNDNIYEYVRDAMYLQVFVLERLPFWENDAQRRESSKEAIKIHEKICEVYSRFDFDIVNVPVLSPKKRRDFILENIIGYNYI